MRKTNSLKAFFTMCLLCVLGTLCAWAQTTVTFVAGTDKSGTSTLTKGGISITLEKGANAQTGKLDNKTYYSFFSGNALTISSTKGYIKEIVFTCTANNESKYGPGNLGEVTPGKYTFKDKTGTWKGYAENVSLTASSLVRATKIEVTYVAEGTVLSPSISVPSKNFDEPFNVTLSSAEGSNIYYTLNGEDPTTSSQKYEGAITIPEQTTTLKAIAEKDGKTSKVAEATYTFEVQMPVIEVASKKFNEEFTTSITASNGADIYYTLDGSDPTTESTKYTVPITISETTTLKAMAVKNGQFSKVAEAKYTFSTVLEGDGTFENPYSPEEIIKMGYAPSSEVWVTGNLLGAAIKTGAGYETLPQNITNIAIGEPGLEKCIAISLPNSLRHIISKEQVGKKITVLGTIDINYIGRPGMGTGHTKRLAGLASIKIKTQEGYATAVIKAPFVVPEGMICSIITDAKDGVLTIENYEAGKVVPAKDKNEVYSGTPVLVKGTPNTEYPLILDKTTTLINSKNLLQAGTGKKFTADANHLYYKLAYDNYDTRSDLGFYWGAADGGAFFVPEGSAYLAVPKSAAASVKSFRLEDATTGITAPIASEGQTVKTVYTIDGRRVQNADHLTKGLYIVNGKKVMIK